MSEKESLQSQLRSAQAELESWEQQRFTREDGSQAQDQRFENRGDHLREKVDELKERIRAVELCD